MKDPDILVTGYIYHRKYVNPGYLLSGFRISCVFVALVRPSNLPCARYLEVCEEIGKTHFNPSSFNL